MKVVIDIPEILLDRIKSAKCVPDMYGSDIVNTVVCVRNSTPYEERPHGEWLISPDKTRACCPFCHNKWTDAKEIALLDTAFRAKNFCEYCGADMRKEGDENG